MEQQKIWDNIAIPWKKVRCGKLSSVLKFLRGKKGKILDLGCGAGRNFVKREGLNYYGVDFSSEMLKLARKYAKDEKINVKLRKAEVFDTGFPGGFFDVAIFNSVLHCVDSAEKRKRAVIELFRIMKPGALAFISVWSKNEYRVKNKPCECKIPWTVDGKKYYRYTYIYSMKKLIKLFEDVGFEVVKSWEDVNINLVVRKPTKL